jgi:hypothetical protein
LLLTLVVVTGVRERSLHHRSRNAFEIEEDAIGVADGRREP